MTLGDSPFADLTGLSRMRFGNHFCHFYEGPADLAEAIVPFIAAGVRNNEQCLWVTCEPFDADQAIKTLRAVIPDLDLRMAQGQIEIISHEDWYQSGGAFDALTVIDGWLERERSALAQGYDGLRITGNTFWLENQDNFDTFMDYEEKLHRALAGRRIVCLCSYCLHKASGKDMLDVVRNHESALIRSGGTWEIIESASIKAAKNELSARLATKERLLTEIHHRVKNNLQIVASLLTLKSAELGPAAAEPMEDIQSRIGAMSLVHELLYEQDCGGSVSLQIYLRRLIQRLSVTYRCGDRIAVSLEMHPTAMPLLAIDTAIPLGIAITEALTNAIKHAFPPDSPGNVVVSVEGNRSETRVTVRDDGRGLGPAEPGNKTGAGTTLMRGLAAQVGGRVDFSSPAGKGTQVAFTIPLAA